MASTPDTVDEIASLAKKHSLDVAAAQSLTSGSVATRLGARARCLGLVSRRDRCVRRRRQISLLGVDPGPVVAASSADPDGPDRRCSRPGRRSSASPASLSPASAAQSRCRGARRGRSSLRCPVRDRVTCRELHLDRWSRGSPRILDQLGSRSAAGETGGDLGRYWPEPRSRMRLTRRRLQRAAASAPATGRDDLAGPPRGGADLVCSASRCTRWDTGRRSRRSRTTSPTCSWPRCCRCCRQAAAPEDEPYLRRVFSSAAQIGAGIGIVERRVRAAQVSCAPTDTSLARSGWPRTTFPPCPPTSRTSPGTSCVCYSRALTHAVTRW